MVPAAAIDRFKTLVGALRQSTAACGDVQRRLNEALQVKHRILAERERYVRTANSPFAGVAARARDRLRELDADLAGPEAEVARLKAELSSIEAKRSAISELVGNCKALLSERGVPRPELNY